MSRTLDRGLPVLVALSLTAASQRRTPALVDPPPWRGVFEWGLPFVLRAFDSLPVGTLLAFVNAIVTFAALALLARLVHRASASWIATVATVGAFAATAAFDRVLAPADMLAALAVGSYAWLQWLRLDERTGEPVKPMARLVVAGVLIPIIEPALLTQFTLLSVGAIGPLPFALGALGVFSMRDRIVSRPAAFALLALIAPGAGLWCFCGTGLAALMSAIGQVGLRRVVALAVAVLVPALQAQRLRLRDTPEERSVYGHERLTSDSMFRLVRMLPEATIVEEDAATDLVFRAATRGRRMGKPLQIVPRDDLTIASAIQHGPVFALPRAQVELSRRGFELRPGPTAMTGVAAVATAHQCVQPAFEWTVASALTSGDALSLVAKDEDARGPVTVYFGSDAPVGAAAQGWVPRNLRGFHLREYKRSERPDLAATLVEQGVPQTSPLLGAPLVTRLLLWRTPTAPRVQVVTLAAPRSVAIARLEPGAASRGLELCPSFNFIVRPIDEAQ